jgi:hypothetical protein
MDSDTRSILQPLEYPSEASRQQNQRARRLIAVGIISLCVSLINLGVNTGFVAIADFIRADAEYELTSRQEDANRSAAQMGFPTPVTLPQSFVEPLKYDHAWALFAVVVFSLDYLPAVMLLIASLVLLRRGANGMKVHKAYCVVKLITATAGCVVILLNCGGPIAFACIPAVLAFVYPITIWVLVRRGSLS